MNGVKKTKINYMKLNLIKVNLSIILCAEKISVLFLDVVLIIKNEDEPQCVLFNCKYTIKHVLINCNNFANIRKKHFNVNNMYDVFNNVPFTNNICIFKRNWNFL